MSLSLPLHGGGGGAALGVTSLPLLSSYIDPDDVFLGDKLVFADDFGEAAVTPLASHTPNLGVDWTLEYQDTGGLIQIIGGVAAPTVNAVAGCLYTAGVSGGIGTADYKVGAKISNSHTYTRGFLIARWQDDDNMYALEYGDAALNGYLWKCVATVWTQIGATFTAVSGSFIELEVEGTNIRARVNGALAREVSDSAISAEGKGGLASGNLAFPVWQYTYSPQFQNFRIVTL